MPLRAAIVSLVDNARDEHRLAQAGSFYTRESLDYDALLAKLLRSSLATLRAATVHHVAELAVAALLDDVRDMPDDPLTRGDRDRVLAQLETASIAVGEA